MCLGTSLSLDWARGEKLAWKTSTSAGREKQEDRVAMLQAAEGTSWGMGRHGR